MADFITVPDFVIEEEPAFDTLISKQVLGVDQERSKRAYALRKWRLRFFNRTQAELNIVRDFFIARKGQFEVFSWNNPIDSEDFYVRFEKDSLKYKYRAYNVYDIECIFQEVFYWSTTTSTSTTSTSSTSTTTSTTSTSTTTTSTSTTSTSTTSTSSTSTTTTTV